MDQRGCTYSERRTAVIEPGRGELHAEPHVRPIYCHVASLSWQELEEELNKLLPMKVSDRDRNVKVQNVGCVEVNSIFAIINQPKNIFHEWWGAGVVICLKRGANDFHMVQLMPLPPPSFLALLEPSLVWPFCCRRIQAVLSPVYTIQPVVKPVVKPVWQPGKCLYTRYNRLSNPLSNRLLNRFDNPLSNRLLNRFDNPLSNRLLNRFHNRYDNRLYRVYKHSTGCQIRLATGLTTGWMFVYTIQPVVKPVVQPVWRPVVSCKRGFRNKEAVKREWVCFDK